MTKPVLFLAIHIIINTRFSSIWTIDKTLSGATRVDLGAMAIKRYFTFRKTRGLLEPHHQIVGCLIQDARWVESNPSAEVQLLYSTGWTYFYTKVNFVFIWESFFVMRLLNLSINFIADFCPHLDSFLLFFSLRFGQISPLAFFRWLTAISDRNTESCNRIPSNYFGACGAADWGVESPRFLVSIVRR